MERTYPVLTSCYVVARNVKTLDQNQHRNRCFVLRLSQADALVECKALRHLDLSNCKLGTFAMRKLAVMMGHCTRLEHLSLAGMRLLKGMGSRV